MNTNTETVPFSQKNQTSSRPRFGHMSVGTKSLLFGVHQFAWHPITVLRAWIHLYGWPEWRVLFCIIVHDWGYWGCENMDGEQGRRHPERGARIASRVLGPKWGEFVLRHSRFLSRDRGVEPSRLCWADKFSMIYDPQWFYLMRARWSGELREYRSNADASHFVPLCEPDWAWHSKLVHKLSIMSREQSLKVEFYE